MFASTLILLSTFVASAGEPQGVLLEFTTGNW